MDESRKQFEKWFMDDVAGASFDFPGFKDGEYVVGEVYDEQLYVMLQSMYMAWTASREAIEIIQPKFIDSREALAKGYTVDYSNGFGDGMDAYDDAIRAAGIKVKE
ncbi:hypothetical protein NEP95_16690 [Escherichia coli]|nr:hypothetical protein [Escherichia coli]EFO4017535.1 hypothetical protein [Escherichia coli]MCT6344007.1 hypothetical protein [Escherichia coli]MDI1110977.1 hypothetical protein [Escherichia coli]MDI1185858.1 hypothetical protein [Escherichia coli]